MFTRLCSGLALIGCLCLAGCGAGPGTTGQSRAATRNLAGSWLLAGRLPEGPFSRPVETQVTVTFGTIGDRFVGLGRAAVLCTPVKDATFQAVASEFTFELQGQVRADGTFSAQSPATFPLGQAIPTVSLTGQVPTTPGAVWSGSYVVDTTQAQGQVLTQASCSQKVSGLIEAAAIQPVTGTYRASGTIDDGEKQSPIKVTVTLQQGVTSTEAGVESDLAYLLGGSIDVEGTSCFHSGTMRPQRIKADYEPTGVGSTVFGATVFPAFSMDDGSELVLNGYIADAEASELDTDGAGVSSGACASTLTRQLRLGHFTRQP